MTVTKSYTHLEERPDTSIHQPFVKGRGIWAEVLYRQTVGDEPRTPEEVAHDYGLPLEAVLEAIDYCVHHEEYLRDERERQLARIREYEKKLPPLCPPDHQHPS